MDGICFFDVVAYALMHYMNGELYTKQATMVFRPELELASPAFFPDDKTVFYVQSISHNISVGGDATTNINSNFGRKDDEPIVDLYSCMLLSQKLYTGGINALTDEDRKNLIKQIPASQWIEQVRKLRDEYSVVQDKPDSTIVTSDQDTQKMKDNLNDLWNRLGVDTAAKEETTKQKQKKGISIGGGVSVIFPKK
jgi:hypothetical protein